MTQIIQPYLEKIVEAVNGDDTQLQLLATQATRYEHSLLELCWELGAKGCKFLFEELSREMAKGEGAW